MTTINHQPSSISFQAKFKKLPVRIEATKMLKEFEVVNPWGKGKLKGQPGDSLAKNLLNGECYPLSPKQLAEKYEHVSGNIYQTRTDIPVYIEADFPKAAQIMSREGAEKTVVDGMQAMEAIDGAGQPYAIPGDYFLKAYAPIDAEGQLIVDKLKAIIAAAGK